MGLITLEQFEADLSKALGQPGTSSPWLKNRVNLAYLEVVTAVEMEALRAHTTLSLVAGAQEVAVPSGLLAVRSMKNVTDDRMMVYIDADNIDIGEATTTGYPTLWAREGTNFIIYPPSAADTSILCRYIKQPTLLTAKTDVTVIPPTWDQAIELLAEARGQQMIGDSGKAKELLAEARDYMGSRLTDAAFAAGQLSAPVVLIDRFDEITTSKGPA